MTENTAEKAAEAADNIEKKDTTTSTNNKRPLDDTTSEQKDGQEATKLDDTNNGQPPSAKKTRTETTQEKKTNTSIFGSSMTFGSAAASSNASSNPTKPLFGFGAAATSSTSSIFGSSTASSTSSIFGKATKTSSTGFGLASSTGSGTSSSSSYNFASMASSSSASKTTVVPLPQSDGPIQNGEENEAALVTLRVKLFKLVKDDKSTSSSSNDKNKDGNDQDAASKPAKKPVGIQMATKVGDETNNGDGDKSKDDANTSKMEWKEVGIGPLRVLSDEKLDTQPDNEEDKDEKSSPNVRIVQRRENTPGGQGTKLILNIPIRKECHVERKGDKFIRLAAFEVVTDNDDVTANDTTTTSTTTTTTIAESTSENTTNGKEKENGEGETNDSDAQKTDGANIKFAPVQYLFKVKTNTEADSLFNILKMHCVAK